MNNFDLYRELYHKENERRQQVQNSLNIPIALVSAFSTAIYFYVTNFDYELESNLNYVFHALIFLSCICIVLAIYYLIRVFLNFSKKDYDYSGLPYAQDLYDYQKDLIEHYNNTGRRDEEADHYFKSYLTANLVKHVDNNMYVNDRKFEFIYRSKRYIVAGLVLTVITMAPFGYNFFKKESKPQDISIVSVPDQTLECKQIKDKLDSLLKQSQTNTNMMEDEEENAPPPPPPPRDRQIKEGSEPAPPPPPKKDEE